MITLSCCPLYHSYALGAALVTTFMASCCLITIDNFIPRRVLDNIDHFKVTFLLLAPDIVGMFNSLVQNKLIDLTSINIALVSAGKIADTMYNQFNEVYHIPLLSNYGSTETGGLVSRIEPSLYASIGRPMYGVQYKIIPSSDIAKDEDEIVKEGELRIKCPGMLSGYVDEKLQIFERVSESRNK